MKISDNTSALTECQQHLKNSIVETNKAYVINMQSFHEHLPAEVTNSFLDFLNTFTPEQQSFLLRLIRKGEITIVCE